MKFSELNWPRKLNLRPLRKFLTERELEMMVMSHLDKDRLKRRIVLPSQKCYRKVIAYHFGCLVEEGKLSWSEVMERIKGSFKTLKELNISRRKVRQLFLQRKKEIENEK